MTVSPAEREDAVRKQILEAFEEIVPNVHSNPWIPHWPTPPQQLFLGLHRRSADDEVFEALYGGAAGGGKSDCLLMAAAQYVHVPTYAALVVRRTFADLALPGAIMDRALSWWRPLGAHWDGSRHTLIFPSGAKIQFGYMQHDDDHLRYKSAEFQLTCWDELTELPLESQYSFVGLSRVRRLVSQPVPLRTLSASNPGGPGHRWVKTRFIGEPENNIPPALSGRYIPARIRDNPHLDQQAYIKGLMRLHPTTREQLLNGDWRARDPGDYFRAEWFGPLLDPATDAWPSSDCIRIRWWDLAASEKPDAARTAGVLMARHRNGVRAIEHARAFRATPGRRDDLIVQQAQTDGHGVIVGIEIEGGSGGQAQFMSLEKRLKALGFKVVGARPRVEMTDAEGRLLARQPSSIGGKQGRADPVASCLERGYQRRGEGPNTGAPWHGIDTTRRPFEAGDGIRLYSGTWTQEFLDEIEGFPDGATCDLVDALSGAWAYLEAHPFGAKIPFEPARDRSTALSLDVHPDDRPVTPQKRWRP